MLQFRVLTLQLLEASRLVHLQDAVLLAPAAVALLGDPIVPVRYRRGLSV